MASGGPDVTEERFVDIESRIAHQEHLIEQLNQALIEQQMRVTGLEKTCRSLAERLRQIADEPQASGSRPEDDRPPHY